MRLRSGPKKTPLADRFASKVALTPDDRGCLLWLGSRMPNGYGQIGSDQPRAAPLKAHRVAWFLAHGRWPRKGLVVMHLCDVPACVNPEHLRVGTQKTNLRDARQKGRQDSRGEKNCQVKFTEAQVREMRERYAAGAATYTSLMADYGMSRSNVYAIVSRRIWSHVE